MEIFNLANRLNYENPAASLPGGAPGVPFTEAQTGPFGFMLGPLNRSVGLGTAPADADLAAVFVLSTPTQCCVELVSLEFCEPKCSRRRRTLTTQNSRLRMATGHSYCPNTSEQQVTPPSAFASSSTSTVFTRMPRCSRWGASSPDMPPDRLRCRPREGHWPRSGSSASTSMRTKFGECVGGAPSSRLMRTVPGATAVTADFKCRHPWTGTPRTYPYPSFTRTRRICIHSLCCCAGRRADEYVAPQDEHVAAVERRGFMNLPLGQAEPRQRVGDGGRFDST